MRITNLLSGWHAPGKGRSPQPENKVPFMEILPLKLKNKVSGKHDKAQDSGCLQEMTLVISCLQKNDFENKFCQKEVETFNNCYKKYLTNKQESKLLKQKGILIPGEKNCNHKQIKKLLGMRPI